MFCNFDIKQNNKNGLSSRNNLTHICNTHCYYKNITTIEEPIIKHVFLNLQGCK
jgi:hypothetical protein